MTSSRDTPWLHRLRPGAAAAPEIMFFPHAGGAAGFFRPLAGLIDPRLAVSAVQYPGRQERRREPLLATIAELADGAYQALLPVLREPATLVGHSMGSVIAFEVARRMERELGQGPAALVVSGRRAPSRPRQTRVHLLNDDLLADEIREAGGTDPRLLADPEIRAMILPVVRADYQAVEMYRYETGPRLRCPVIVLSGADDPAVSGDEAQAWAEHTDGPFTLRWFPGGHFFIADHGAEVAGVISDQVLTLAG